MKKLLSSSNIIFIFMALSALLSLIYLWKSFLDFGLNNRLDKKTEAYITRFQIDEDEKKYKYFIGAFYEYNVGGKKFEGKTDFNKKKFLSYYAALDAIKKMNNEKQIVSYSSKDPAFSRLEYHFNLKNMLYFCISFTVLVYFYILRRRLKKFE